jgi:Uncharacterized conserved protein
VTGPDAHHGEPPDASPERIRAVLDLTIRLAEVVFGAGSGAAEATAAMSAVARSCGLRDTESDTTHTMLSLTWTDAQTHESVSRSRNVKHRNLDYARLAATSALISEVADRPMEVAEARRRLAAIVTARPQVPRLLRRVGWSLVGAGAAMLLGGGAFVAIVAFVATFIVDLLTSMLAARAVPVFYQSCVGGAIGPLAAGAVHLIDPTASASLVVVATIIMLLAGVTTFGAVHDTLSGFYLTGTARLMEALVITVGVAAGVSGMSLLLGRLGMPLNIGAHLSVLPAGAAVPLIAAVVIVVGFSLAVQVPWRALWVVCVLGALAESIYLLGVHAGFGVVWSSAAAAVVTGVLAALTGRLSRTPSLAIVVTSLVPLVPGLVLFNGLMQLVAGSVAGVLGMLTAAAVAGALAAGAILGQYLVQLTWGRTRGLPRRVVGPLTALPARFARSRTPRR